MAKKRGSIKARAVKMILLYALGKEIARKEERKAQRRLEAGKTVQAAIPVPSPGRILYTALGGKKDPGAAARARASAKAAAAAPARSGRGRGAAKALAGLAYRKLDAPLRRK